MQKNSLNILSDIIAFNFLLAINFVVLSIYYYVLLIFVINQLMKYSFIFYSKILFLIRRRDKGIKIV